MVNKLALSLALLFAALVATGCGDSEGPVGGGNGGGGNTFHPSSDTELSGNQSFSSVEIPQGVTVRASSDLVLISDTQLIVEGRLVGDCVQIELRGEVVEVRGTVANECSGPASSQPGLSISSEGSFTLEGALLSSSGDVRLGNDPASIGSIVPAQDIGCAISNARMESRPERAATGSEGTGIDGASWRISCRGAMEFANTRITAQHGGEGGDSEATASPAMVSGGSGGSGGQVAISGRSTIRFTGVNVLSSGDGGAGGDATAAAVDPGTGARAFEATAIAGDGGDSGAIQVEADGTLDVTAPLTLVLGVGGAGGNAQATGSSGLDATSEDPAQAGGNATAIGGKGGDVLDPIFESGNVVGLENVFVQAAAAGDGGVAAAQGGEGGEGGVSFSDGAPGGDIEVVGGDGGDMNARRPNEEAVAATAGVGGAILAAGANGGDGGGACPTISDPEASPGAGGDGGTGGSVSGRDGRPGAGGIDAPPAGGAVFTEVGNGGDGGNGTPPGTAGDSGDNATQITGSSQSVPPSFTPGRTGEACKEIRNFQLTATIELQRGGDPAGHDPDIFDVSSQPEGSVTIELTVVESGTRITISGAEPWVDVEGTINPDRSVVASGTGRVKGFDGSRVEFTGFFSNRVLSGEYTMIPGDQTPITYRVQTSK